MKIFIISNLIKKNLLTYLKKILIIFFILFFSKNSAIEDKKLSLKELVNQVLQRNPNILSVQDRIRAGRFAVPRVQAWEDPRFAIVTKNNAFKYPSEFMPQVRFEISQLFPTSGTTYAQGRIAKKILDALKSEEITTSQELVLQTKKSYFGLLFNHMSKKINCYNQKISQQIIDASLAVYRSGKGGQEDILKSQIELEMLKNEFFNLESEQETIKAMINVLLNKSQDNIVNQPEERFYKSLIFSFQELKILALKKRPELHEMQSMVEEQYAREKLARQKYYPDTMVGFMYQWARRAHESAWGATVGINVPIWIEGKQKLEAQEARANAFAQQQSLYGMQSIIEGKIRELLAKLSVIDKQIELYRDSIVPKTFQTFKTSLAKYKVGKGDFIFLLDTRRQLYNTQLEYYRLRIDREILLAELERAVGEPLGKFAKTTNTSL
ncbi:TolC family protein [Candidatus Babeliales bacterium]|nr:TolC family protein [Candidatus Babeliales bacterium]